MQKITKILAEAGESFHTENSSSADTVELNRIANALERIAASLEKLTGEKSNTANPDNQRGESKVFELENNITHPLAPVKPITPTLRKKALPAVVEEVKPKIISSQTSILEEHLKIREITSSVQKKQIFTPERDEILDKIAFHLGKNYTECNELYLTLKANSKSSSITYKLYGATSRKNTKVQKFCKLLESANLLKNYEYLGSPVFQLEFNPINITSHNKNFVDGKWLERYLKQEVQRIVSILYPKLGYEARPNLQIQFKKQSGIELSASAAVLDLLFSVGQHIFCIEAKTNAKFGELEKHLNKIELLGLAKQNIMIVAAENSVEERQELAQALNGTKIVGLDNFEEALIAMIKAACDPPK